MRHNVKSMQLNKHVDILFLFILLICSRNSKTTPLSSATLSILVVFLCLTLFLSPKADQWCRQTNYNYSKM